MNRFGMSLTREENFLQTQLKFPTTKSIYLSSMPVNMHDNNPFSSRIEDITNRKEQQYLSRMEPIREESNFSFNPAMVEKFNNRSPRTPSPPSHQNLNRTKLELLNSFSKDCKKEHENENTSEGDYQSYASTMEKSKKKNTDSIVNEELCSSKRKKKKVCCNCKKSRCLKLYCDCFNRGQPCAGDCSCVNCLNTEAHFKERQEAMNSVLEKNPSAFKPKIDRTNSPEKVN